jgi:hypothetical protein
MERPHLIEATKNQLDRVLGFFPRADAKASVVLAVDTGMLAILAANAPSLQTFHWPALLGLIPTACIAISLWHLYKGAFPSLEGGQSSLIYFREIAKRTEHKFIEEFIAQKEEDYIKDMLGQIWRNSEILKEKFDHLSRAFNWLALAILPWAVVLAFFVTQYGSAQGFLIK